MGACYRDITGGAPGGLKSHCGGLEGTVGLDGAELYPILCGPCGPGAVQAQSYPAASPQPAPALENGALACALCVPG